MEGYYHLPIVMDNNGDIPLRDTVEMGKVNYEGNKVGNSLTGNGKFSKVHFTLYMLYNAF